MNYKKNENEYHHPILGLLIQTWGVGLALGLALAYAIGYSTTTQLIFIFVLMFFASIVTFMTQLTYNKDILNIDKVLGMKNKDKDKDERR